MRSGFFLVASALAACGTVSGLSGGVATGDGDASAPDASPDAPPLEARCALDARFGDPRVLDVNTEDLNKSFARLSPDERSMFFAAGDGGDGQDLWFVQRPSASAAFAPDGAVRLTVSDARVADDPPSVSPDALWLAFDRGVALPDGGATRAVFTASRAQEEASFGPPAQQLELGPGANAPYFTLDGSELWYSQDGRLKVAVRQGSVFVKLSTVEIGGAPVAMTSPVLSADKQTLFFAGGVPRRVFMTHRSSTGAPWETPAVRDEFGAAAATFPTWLSPDGCRLYLTTSDGSATSLWVAERFPN